MAFPPSDESDRRSTTPGPVTAAIAGLPAALEDDAAGKPAGVPAWAPVSEGVPEQGAQQTAVPGSATPEDPTAPQRPGPVVITRRVEPDDEPAGPAAAPSTDPTPAAAPAPVGPPAPAEPAPGPFAPVTPAEPAEPASQEPEPAPAPAPEEAAVPAAEGAPGREPVTAGPATPEPAAPAPHVAPSVVKIVVAGGFAVGKTTFIGSISDIEPLNTEAAMTEHSVGVDDAGGVSDRKSTTTVAMDFGRIELPGNLWLYLFGTPGQDRFLFMWDDLARGAIGAVVLVDTDRIEHCFPAIDYFESRGIPFVVGINCFDGVAKHRIDDVREALQLGEDVPVLYTDARSRTATKQTLVALVQVAMRQVSAA